MLSLDQSARRLGRFGVARCLGAIRGLAFWVAVVLALSYPIVFVVADLGAVGGRTVVGFVIVHFAFALLGHPHDPSPAQQHAETNAGNRRLS